jgi:hypothetical protein
MNDDELNRLYRAHATAGFLMMVFLLLVSIGLSIF